MFNIINPPVLGSVIKFTGVILANNNSLTITHSLGRIASVNGVYGLDDNANVFKIINEGLNSFDVAFAGGIAQPTNTGIEGTYV